MKRKDSVFLDCTVNNNNKCTECLGTQACVASIKSSICLVEGKLELNYPASYIHTYIQEQNLITQEGSWSGGGRNENQRPRLSEERSSTLKFHKTGISLI